ncbi:hypothetical protein OG21DRAFT_1479311 [Imleria badia]|nr:hypothetical protein OG21DRAFT_1479311 [Imleria badia]
MKDWTSPVYVFFQPTPIINVVGTRHSHVFKCCARGCKNMRKHTKKCWGLETLQATDSTKDVAEVHNKIVGSILCNGSITESFKRKGKGKVTYSHRQHMCAKTKAEIIRWVYESLQPFTIVKDCGFQLLMQTGHLEYNIPSKLTILHDNQLVFARSMWLDIWMDVWLSI